MLAFIQHSGSANFTYSTGIEVEGAFHVFSDDFSLNVLIVPDMEGERAKRESKVRNVLTYSEIGYYGKIEESLSNFLIEKGVKRVSLPEDFPAKIAFHLSSNFYVKIEKSPISKMRAVKSKREVEMIKESCLAAVKAFKFLTKMLKKKNRTCEELRELIELKLFSWGFIAEKTIIASGERTCEPHWLGYGEIKEHLIVDVFPKSRRHGYYGDFTRTLILQDNEEIKNMLKACVEAKEKAEKIVKPGIRAKDIHNVVCDVLESYGYETLRKNSSEGFIHSTGHGVGLEVHEEPRIFDNDDLIEKGMVFTIEPGLYYKGIGGVRVEDTIVVRDRAEVLTPCENFPEVFT